MIKTKKDIMETSIMWVSQTALKTQLEELLLLNGEQAHVVYWINDLTSGFSFSLEGFFLDLPKLILTETILVIKKAYAMAYLLGLYVLIVLVWSDPQIFYLDLGIWQALPKESKWIKLEKAKGQRCALQQKNKKVSGNKPTPWHLCHMAEVLSNSRLC